MGWFCRIPCVPPWPGLVKSLSNEYARYNVLVNNVCPGYTATERLKSIGARPEGQIPLGRVADAGGVRKCSGVPCVGAGELHHGDFDPGRRRIHQSHHLPRRTSGLPCSVGTDLAFLLFAPAEAAVLGLGTGRQTVRCCWCTAAWITRAIGIGWRARYATIITSMRSICAATAIARGHPERCTASPNTCLDLSALADVIGEFPVSIIGHSLGGDHHAAVCGRLSGPRTQGGLDRRLWHAAHRIACTGPLPSGFAAGSKGSARLSTANRTPIRISMPPWLG